MVDNDMVDDGMVDGGTVNNCMVNDGMVEDGMVEVDHHATSVFSMYCEQRGRILTWKWQVGR